MQYDEVRSRRIRPNLFFFREHIYLLSHTQSVRRYPDDREPQFVLCVFFFGETRVGTNKFRCFVMMALALFLFSQLLFPLLLLVFLRPPPIPKLDDKKEAREDFFVSCSVQTQRFSRIRTKKRREGNQDGRKSPPEIREEEEEADSGGRAKVCGNKKKEKAKPPSFPILLHTRNSNGELLLFFLPHQRTLFFSFSFACLQFCSWKYTGKGGMWMWGLLFPPPPPPFHSTHVSGRKSGGLGRSGPGRAQRFQRGVKFHLTSDGDI